MGDYISREALIRKLHGIPVLKDHPNLKAMCFEWANAIPAADVAPVVHGEWKPCGHYSSDTHMICKCSVCGDTVWVYYNSEREWNYCPNCGAKMDKLEG